MVECLPSKCEALSSNPQTPVPAPHTAKKKKKKERERERERQKPWRAEVACAESWGEDAERVS
jgi:hypothetical protein